MSWLCVTCTDERGIAAVCCFEPYLWFDWHFSVAVERPHSITRRLLKAMFTAVFSEAVRVTALVEPGNGPALRQVELMGFQPEGFVRRAVEGRRDALLFGMLREDCRYLPQTSVRPAVLDDVIGASLHG